MPFDLAAAYERYALALYRYARRHGRTHEEAEDLVADVFVEAATRQHAYEDRGYAPSAWLYRIAFSRLIDDERRKKRHPLCSLDAFLAADVSPAAIDPPDDRIADRLDRRALLDRASLTPDQRQVLYLRFAEDRSPAEVAATIGRSVGAVKALQHRAIASLEVLVPGP